MIGEELLREERRGGRMTLYVDLDVPDAPEHRVTDHSPMTIDLPFNEPTLVFKRRETVSERSAFFNTESLALYFGGV